MRSYKIDLLDDNFDGDIRYQDDRGCVMTIMRRDSERRMEHKGVHAMYVLIDDNRSMKKGLYVGQTKDVARRMRDHEKLKDFWNYILVFTKDGMVLTRTQIEWLEMMCIKRCVNGAHFDTMHNHQIPNDVVVSDADKEILEDMYYGILDMMRLYGILEFEGEADISKSTKTPKMLKRVLSQYNNYSKAVEKYKTSSDDDGMIYVIGDDTNVTYFMLGERVCVGKGSTIRQLKDTDAPKRQKMFQSLQNALNADGTFVTDAMIPSLKDLDALID